MSRKDLERRWTRLTQALRGHLPAEAMAELDKGIAAADLDKAMKAIQQHMTPQEQEDFLRGLTHPDNN